MTRIIGFLFFILIVWGWAGHMDGATWVAIAFYLGCVGIIVAIIAAVIRRHW